MCLFFTMFPRSQAKSETTSDLPFISYMEYLVSDVLCDIVQMMNYVRELFGSERKIREILSCTSDFECRFGGLFGASGRI